MRWLSNSSISAGLLVSLLVWLVAAAAPVGPGIAGRRGELISRRFQSLTRDSKWRLTASIPLGFDTHHPQGLVRVGDHFYLSSVEVTRQPQRYVNLRNGEQVGQGGQVGQVGMDRDTGEGVGHLFKFDTSGRLLADLRLGESTIYHPGGIDFDGREIWIPVAEYRPNSRSIVYTVNPEGPVGPESPQNRAGLKAVERFRFADHLGGIIHDRSTRTLHAVSWGSRRFYRWRLTPAGNPIDVANGRPHPNGSFYIDYQDCKSLGNGEMLCAGLSRYRDIPLGGIDLIDLASGRALRQLPFEPMTNSGRPMTQNPFWIEPIENGLVLWFIPEDGRSTLYRFETIMARAE